MEQLVLIPLIALSAHLLSRERESLNDLLRGINNTPSCYSLYNLSPLALGRVITNWNKPPRALDYPSTKTELLSRKAALFGDLYAPSSVYAFVQIACHFSQSSESWEIKSKYS